MLQRWACQPSRSRQPRQRATKTSARVNRRPCARCSPPRPPTLRTIPQGHGSEIDSKQSAAKTIPKFQKKNIQRCADWVRVRWNGMPEPVSSRRSASHTLITDCRVTPSLLASRSRESTIQYVVSVRRLARLHSGFLQTNPHGSALAVG